jgi:hypothetical protein
MAKKTISPREQKEKELTQQFNRVRSLYSFGSLKSWDSILHQLGIDTSSTTIPYYWSFIYPDLYLKPTHGDLQKFFDAVRTYTLQQFDKPVISLAPTPKILEPLPTKSSIHELVKGLLPPKNPKQRATLFYFQQHAAEEMFYKLLQEKINAVLLRANTGDGKTYAYGQIFRWLIDCKYHEGKTFSPFPYVIVTAPSIIEQTKRDMENEFGLEIGRDIDVVGYPALRSSYGSMMLQEVETVNQGDYLKVWQWKPFLYPICICWDECHWLKNPDSEQSKIGQAYNNIEDSNIIQIFSSATPFSRVEGAKVFSVATKTRVNYGAALNVPLNNDLWPLFSRDIAGKGADPKDYSKESIKRLCKRLAPHIVGFKNVRKKFKAINRVRIIDFETLEKKAKYDALWEEFQKRKNEIEGKDLSNSSLLILVQFNVFRAGAEFLKAETFAELMYQAHVEKGKASLFAGSYKATHAKIVHILNTKYGVPRSKISLIWGGEDMFKEDGKYTVAEMQDIIKKMLTGQTPASARVLAEFSRQMSFKQQGLGELPDHLQLGSQNYKQRQDEIDKFQGGRSQFCLFTFKAGGAGLSLHQNKKELLSRYTVAAPTYNEMEMHQALGRAPRLTSLSDTEQDIVLYKGTIEEHVLAKLNAKSRCLHEVIQHSDTVTKYSQEVEKILQMSGAQAAEEEGGVSEQDYQDMEDNQHE